MKKNINLDIQGMHCASCSALIEISLKNRQGIENVSVNLLANSAHLIFDDDYVRAEDVISIIHGLGYKASLAEEGEKKKP
jgi:copper chaperone CopZ